MPLVKCPDCGKSISSLAPVCIGCGRPMIEPARTQPETRVLGDPTATTRYVIAGSEHSKPLSLEELRQAISGGKMKYADRVRAEHSREWIDLYQLLLNIGASSAQEPSPSLQPQRPAMPPAVSCGATSNRKDQTHIAPPISPERRVVDSAKSLGSFESPGSRAHVTGGSDDQIDISEQSKKGGWSWKSLGLAFLLALVLNVFVAAASGGKPVRNMWWTVMWMYLSIEGWKVWKWKALLPYPLFAVASLVVGLVTAGRNAEEVSLAYIVSMGVLNLGGLVFFAIALKEARSTQS